MDRRRDMSPLITRQWSNSSSGESMSPAASTARHPYTVGGGGLSTIKRNQNVAAKDAARRLAQAMATQAATDDDDDDVEDGDIGFRFRPPSSLTSPNSSEDGSRTHNHLQGNLPAISGGTNRSPSPALGRNFVINAPSVRSTSAGRRSTITRTTAVVPPSKNSVKTPAVIPPVELPTTKFREKRSTPEIGRLTPEIRRLTPEIGRLTPEIGQNNLNDQGSQQDSSALLDELDMIQGENETIREQLRRAEAKREEAEARARQLEQQVAALGEGVSLEAKLLSRKEAALRQREAALKAVKQRKDGKDGEIATLRSELENLKVEAATAMDHLQDVESEAKALRIMTQRMILTQEEMEEVVLKRCWLARYWGLAVQLGICSDIAVLKHEHWSAFAPLPFEVVFSAGQKAKEDFLSKGHNDLDKQGTLARHPSDLTGDGNIESMLSVEMGLRELASLKIEDAVMIALAQQRRPNFVRDYKAPTVPKFTEAYELNQEENQDVIFKQAWLTYFWKRARDHGVEEDIAEDRLQYWVSRSGLSLTSHDAVDVDRSLIELRKLGIKQQLWEASRKEIENLSFAANGNHKQQQTSESEASS